MLAQDTSSRIAEFWDTTRDRDLARNEHLLTVLPELDDLT